jgi:hypothetical protein
LLGFTSSGPGQRPDVTDAELVCLAMAQVLLRYDDERHCCVRPCSGLGTWSPRPLRQSEYNQRARGAGPLMEAALRWLADHTPASAELVRLLDATPVLCCRSKATARRF